MTITDEESREIRQAFEDIGGLVVSHSQIDAELSEFIAMLFSGRQDVGLLDPIIKTMEMSRKVEILRSFLKAAEDSEGLRFGLSLCKKIEKVSFRRNIVCHGLPWHKDGKLGFKLDSAAKYFHPNREKYVVYAHELRDDVIYARKVLELMRQMNRSYKTSADAPSD